MENTNVHPGQNSSQQKAESEMTKSCVSKADVTGVGEREEDGLICDYCSESAEELFPIEDSDASVGYRNSIEVCKRCLENPRTYEERYAARVDRDYEIFKERGF